MNELKDIKGVIFDYGGTIDTDSLHWSEVLWQGYQAYGAEVSKEQFRECYVFAERALAKTPYIKPHHNFHDLLDIKVDIETRHLKDNGLLSDDENKRNEMTHFISDYCYNFVIDILKTSRPILKNISARYKTVLVSNFYGNINAVLDDFGLNDIFSDIIESSVVGIRKPDPRIFSLGVEALGEAPDDVVVIGDSYKKDIVPAHTIGCKTVWIKGKGWDDEEFDEKDADYVIGSIKELNGLFGPQC